MIHIEKNIALSEKYVMALEKKITVRCNHQIYDAVIEPGTTLGELISELRKHDPSLPSRLSFQLTTPRQYVYRRSGTYIHRHVDDGDRTHVGFYRVGRNCLMDRCHICNCDCSWWTPEDFIPFKNVVHLPAYGGDVTLPAGAGII